MSGGAEDPGDRDRGSIRIERLTSALRRASTLSGTPTAMRGFVPAYARRPPGRSRIPGVAADAVAVVVALGSVTAQAGAARARHQLRAVLASVLSVAPVPVELTGERMGTRLRLAASRPDDLPKPREHPRPAAAGRRSGITFTHGSGAASGPAPRHRRPVDPDDGPDSGFRFPAAAVVGAGFAPANPFLPKDRYAQLTAQRAVEFVCAFLDTELGPDGWVAFDSAVSAEVHGDRIAVTLTTRSTGVAVQLPEIPADPFRRHLFVRPARSGHPG